MAASGTRVSMLKFLPSPPVRRWGGTQPPLNLYSLPTPFDPPWIRGSILISVSLFSCAHAQTFSYVNQYRCSWNRAAIVSISTVDFCQSILPESFYSGKKIKAQVDVIRNREYRYYACGIDKPTISSWTQLRVTSKVLRNGYVPDGYAIYLSFVSRLSVHIDWVYSR